MATQQSQDLLRKQEVEAQLDRRYQLSMEEYDELLFNNGQIRFGTQDLEIDSGFIPQARKVHPYPTVFLKRISGYHREYEWVS